MYRASGKGGRWGWGVHVQAFSFMFWVLHTAVKMICFELMDTIPVHIGRFKWVGSIKKNVCNRKSDSKI